MHYNLLYYGETTTSCTANNNSVNNKDTYLKRIVNHVQPDVLTVNEIDCDVTYSRRIKELVLNTGSKTYEFTKIQRSGTQNICNMLFYNTEKVKIASQEMITKAENGSNIIRAIDLYKLQFLATNLSENQNQTDTPSTYILAAHLKASSSASDKLSREKAAGGVMKYLEDNKNPGSYILCGDLNLYTNTEGAWSKFTDWTNASFNFQDPINRVGKWGNNSDYADVHTQSTHTSSGCHSGGGMDDRFDFILASQYIMNGRGSVQYIPGTYKALGQDGKRYNGRLDSPINRSAPAAVIDALYNMSDHLPVIIDVEVIFGQAPNSVSKVQSTPKFEIWQNNQQQLVVSYSFDKVESTLSLRNVTGKVVDSWQLTQQIQKLDLNDLPKGAYLLILEDHASNQKQFQKLILR